VNDLRADDRPVHNWYRFVLSFPPHLVRDYLSRFGVTGGQTVLDPFCGTGTTAVECKKLGISAVGLEANPMAHFASKVKTDWSPDPTRLMAVAAEIADAAQTTLEQQAIDDLQLHSLPPESTGLLLKESIDPLPLHKTLVLLDHLNLHRERPYFDHLRLALARSTVEAVSNLHFGPEVGVRGHKPLAAVISPWLTTVKQMADDIERLSSGVHLSGRSNHVSALPK
jgi:hypothetical protein